MRNARTLAVVQSIVALVAILLAVVALVITLVTTSEENANTNGTVCLYVNGILDAFHTPQGQQAAQNIRVHYPALNKCKHL